MNEDGILINLEKIVDNNLMLHSAKFSPKNIKGIQINLIKPHPTLGKFDEKPIFGIYKLHIKSATKGLLL